MTENQTTFSGADCSDPSIEHYGVKGMKWGVWNAETRAKYAGGLGRASNAMKTKISSAGGSIAKGSKAATRFLGAKVSAKAKNAAANRAQKAARKKELKEQRKELGMSKKQYDKLRDRTLKSHDPSVVAKGMHTLTDDELNAKINRLQKEETISKLASSQQVRRDNVAKARSERVQSSIPYKIGKGYLDKYVDQKIKSIGVKADGGGGKSDKGSSNEPSPKINLNGSQDTQSQPTPSSQYVQNPTYGAPKQSRSSEGYVNWNAAKSLPGNVTTSKVNSSKAKNDAAKGRSWIDDDIIDVTPSDYSGKKKR